jgi:hypothetical protein
LSLTALAAALLGAGIGGLVSDWAHLGALTSVIVAAVCGTALAAVLQLVALPYLRCQQSNSHRGRVSYIGLLGTVTLEVTAGGWGEVTFVDADSSRVRSRAKNTEPRDLPKSTPVYIADVDDQFVYVVSAGVAVGGRREPRVTAVTDVAACHNGIGAAIRHALHRRRISAVAQYPADIR